MKKFIKENWHEIMGWITIIIFIYIYLFRMYEFTNLVYGDRDFAFNFLVIAVIFILGWLKLNNKK